MDLDRFRLVLLNISSEIHEKELSRLKFLCSKEFGRRILEEISEPLDLWTRLQEKCLIKPDNIRYLKDLLKKGLPNREDIIEKLESYENSTYNLCSNTQPRDLSKEIELLCDHLPLRGRKMFVRRLGLSDSEIDGIVFRFPNDAREQFWRMLKLSIDKRNITKQDLIKTLKECHYNHTAELLNDMHIQ